MKVRELFAEFDAFNVDNRKPKTVESYRGRLKRFVERFGDREFAEITPQEFQEHLTIIGKGLSDSTRRSNGVAIKRMQKFAIEEIRVLAEVVTGKLELPPQGMRERILTADEIAKIRRAASPEFDLIFQTLLASGARPGELCAAQIDNLKDDGTVIELADHKTVRKTKRSRRIMVGKRLNEFIAAAVGDRIEGPLFLSPRGKQWTVSNLSGKFRDLRNKTGLSDELCLYLCRHTFATQAVASIGLDEAARLLGHANIATTVRYTHPNEDRLRSLQDDIGDAAEAA